MPRFITLLISVTSLVVFPPTIGGLQLVLALTFVMKFPVEHLKVAAIITMYITSWLKVNYTSGYLKEIMSFSNGLRLHDTERNNKSFQRSEENLYLKYIYGFRDGDIRFEIRVG